MEIFNLSKQVYLFKNANRPEVGIWWMIGSDFVKFSEPTLGGNYSYSNFLHDTYWIKVQQEYGKKYPYIKYRNYFEVPRGRVESTPQGFVIMSGLEQTQDKSLISKIMRYFRLPANLTKVVLDEHLGTEPVDEFNIMDAYKAPENQTTEEPARKTASGR